MTDLFLLSSIALFLELMLIRWAPSVVLLVAYYVNLLLISSFLGLGLGAMTAGRKPRFFGWFPSLLALEVAVLVLGRHALLSVPGSEARFMASAPKLAGFLALIAVFATNTAVFVSLGARIGSLLQDLPRLPSYSANLGGSLCGTIAFGVFSYFYFSPLLGLLAVMAIYVLLASPRARPWCLPPFGLVLVLVSLFSSPGVIWSPYHHITVHPPAPAADARPTEGPPVLYAVHVNEGFYQIHGSINPKLYPPGPVRALVTGLRDQYLLPYLLVPGRSRAVVLGSGGGMDVEAALLSGMRQVDAVEIDPALVALSGRLNAAKVYADPRVRVRVDDARAFLRKAVPGYDLVSFGFLDSQALFTSMTNLRLDAYIYTVESIRSAWRLVGPRGALSISFAARQGLRNGWIAEKLIRTVTLAAGRSPVVYAHEGQTILLAFRAPPRALPKRLGRFRLDRAEPRPVPIPTDDWPYLYLRERTVPVDYLAVIGFLLLVSWLVTRPLWKGASHRENLHFFGLGFGFMMLETRSVTDYSLFFGATWLVTTAVVAGVLLMSLAANVLAMRYKGGLSRLYVPLFVSLLLVLWFPRDFMLGFPAVMKLAWAGLVVPSPLFFSGMIFSTSFRKSRTPAARLGANLIGATFGGFSEYLGMATGHRFLGVVILAAYLGSYYFRIRKDQ